MLFSMDFQVPRKKLGFIIDDDVTKLSLIKSMIPKFNYFSLNFSPESSILLNPVFSRAFRNTDSQEFTRSSLDSNPFSPGRGMREIPGIKLPEIR